MTKAVIVGGGVGGLEAALALKSLAFDHVDVTMVTPERHFTYRPLAVGEPFGVATAWRFELDAIARESNFTLIRDALDHVDPNLSRIVTQDRATIDFDALILAIGARAREAVPGAITFRGPQDAERVSEALRNLPSGEPSRIVFAVPGTTTWTLPIYELALLTAAWSENEGLDLEVIVVTTESTPLAVFGPDASDHVSKLLEEAGVILRTESFAEAVEDGKLWLTMEGSIPVDLVITMPRLVGPKVPGITHDDLGFVPVNEYGLVDGFSNIYAIGDMTTWPIKQGGLASQQADVVAGAIAANAGANLKPHPYGSSTRASPAGTSWLGLTPR
jgi:sulfide:quinone oxidoreductase